MSEPKRWYKPKLIEVSIPLEEINKESAREKSIRHGHPSTLHLWWARRPLAACRAVLFAQLVDDPSADPDRFLTEEDQKAERERLHGIIKRLVVWENIHDEALLKEAREEIWKSCDGNPPPILDPFAGGGSIPLEAQRLGLEAHASDLNPVAVLINKALIEIPPKFADRPPVFPGAAESQLSWPGATGMAEDVRRYGQWMRDEAEKRVGHLYPKAKLPDGTEATVIAWIWARTARCQNPVCGASIPLMSTYWLSKRSGHLTWLQPVVQDNEVRFEVRTGPPGPPEPPKRGRGAQFACIVCGSLCDANAVHHQIDTKTNPAPMLVAIVADVRGRRTYVAADDLHTQAAMRCIDSANTLIASNDFIAAPARGTFGGNAQGRRYGFLTFADYFAPRQIILLSTYSQVLDHVRQNCEGDALKAGLPTDIAEYYTRCLRTYLALACSRTADLNNTLVTWSVSRDQTRNLFSRQAISMAWDYAEVNPFADAAGDLAVSVRTAARVISELPATGHPTVGQADATDREFGPGIVVCTDPPYYDNIGYSDLSDFFYVWLRGFLSGDYKSILGTVLTPKSSELVADVYRFGSRKAADNHFEDGFTRTFTKIREAYLGAEAPLVLFYAFKQTEDERGGGVVSTGWEKMLQGLIAAGLVVTSTWPMRTERAVRSVGIGTNALASSIILACRPRSAHAETTDRRGVIGALRDELPAALRRLQQGGVAPVDLPQAAIGPGMAVFSRYARVNEPDGSAMKVRPALALINQVLDEVLSQQEGDFGSDARWCLEWFKSYGFEAGPFGVAETLSKAKNTSIAGLEHAGVLTSRAGKVRLLSAADLPAIYDPAADDRASEWEVLLHLAKRLSEQGADAAAQLFAAAKSVVDPDAVRELAYLLFSIAEKRGWAEIALLFNGLGTSWPDLAEASRRLPAVAAVQDTLIFGPEED